MARSRSSCSQGRPAKTKPDFVECPVATRFWQQGYRQLCEAEFPDLLLHLQPSQSDKKYTWPKFQHPSLEALSTELYHKPEPKLAKLGKGHLDIQFTGRSEEEVRRLVGSSIPADVELVQNRGSTSLRIEVPRIMDDLPFKGQEDHVRAALRQVRQLLTLSVALVQAAQH
jgi:hypothetical protein